jgi:hypothetical protein
MCFKEKRKVRVEPVIVKPTYVKKDIPVLVDCSPIRTYIEPKYKSEEDSGSHVLFC